MADGAAGGGSSAQDWMLDQIAGECAALVVSRGHPSGADQDDDQAASIAHDREGLDTLAEALSSPDTGAGADRACDRDSPTDDDPVGAQNVDVDAGARRAAVWLGSTVLAVAVGIVLAFALSGSGPEPVAPPAHHTSSAPVSAAPTTTNPAVAQQEQALPFTAHTDSCTPGGGPNDQSVARSPQALTDTTTDSAWVCGRGPQESLVDGQILHVQFGCDATRSASACSYILNAVSVTPGWVAKTTAGNDAWLAHRVVRRLQFNFFNGDQLATDPFFLDTHNVHGPVTATLPGNVLASRVDVIILHTERPPAAPLPAATAPPQSPGADSIEPDAGMGAMPGPVDPIPPAPDDSIADGNPVDATFAISQMQFLGHAPR